MTPPTFTRRRLLAASGAALAWSAFKPLAYGVSSVDSSAYPNGCLLIEGDELEGRLLEGAGTLRVLDFRDPTVYLAGHLPQAASLWHPEITVAHGEVPGFVAPPETVAEALGARGVGRDSPVVVYGDTGGIWAARLFWVLSYYGHSDVRVLNGGFPRWQQLQRPLQLGSVEPTPAAFDAQAQPQILVDADWILEHGAEPGVVLVDARDPDTYAAGHIPGAQSKHWRDNIDWDSERFKPADALRARFEADGVVPEKTVISYCQTGVLSAQNYFALRLLGYPDMRLYDGSFADWRSDPGRPIATGTSP